MLRAIKEWGRRLRITFLHDVAIYRSLRMATEDCGNTVIIAPHPDDEVLGCGGLIARLSRNGQTPHIIVLTRGEHSHDGCCDEDTVAASRRQLTETALRTLGVPLSHLHGLAFADGNVSPDNREETQKLFNLLGALKPNTIFVPHSGEGWNDHVKVKDVISGNLLKQSQIYEYCVWMWYYNIWGLQWKNARLLDMTDEEYALKQKASAQYLIPLAPCGKPWSGVLPEIFVKATQWNKELYFKTR